MRLPLGPFFEVCAILLLVLAVAFAGQGVSALQEAGVIPPNPVPFIRLSLLGIFPTLQTLAAQATIVAVIFALSLYRRTTTYVGDRPRRPRFSAIQAQVDANRCH